MIRAFYYDPESKSSKLGAIELVDVWKTSSSAIIWLDIEGDDEGSSNQLFQQFEINPFAIQDASRPRHPPKIERFQDFEFILLRGLGANMNGIDTATIQLSLFVGERFFITWHRKQSVSTNWLFDTLQTNPELMAGGPGALAVRLTNRLARRYIEILLELEPRLDEIEDEMFSNPDDTLLAELTAYKSRLRKLSRTANYHLEVATQLRTDSGALFDDSLNHEIADLYDQVERTQTLASMYYQICNDLTDGYLGMTSHQLNKVMQLLTIITVIFVPLTFMAGIYGMNFEYIPELAFRSGYFILLTVMLVVAVLQILYFRRRRWL